MAASSSPSSSSSSSLSTFPPKLPSSTTNYPNSSNPNNNPSKFNPQITNTDFNSDPPLPPSPSLKLKPSVQLNRWSRTRALRSNRRFKNPDQPTTVTTAGMNSPIDQKTDHNNKSNLDNSEDERERKTEEEKSIYMVSDGTGWTAEHYVGAALGQFEHCLRDRGCSLNTHIFSGIGDTERLLEIIKQAAKEGAMLVYTLADPTMADSAKQACEMWGVPSTDILSPITEAISAHLGVSPSGIPRGAPGRHVTLSEDYFRRIEAIEFTIKQDDGALPQNLHKADIILAGVSRTGKTPLSIYLSQKGYKVANVPIVMGVELPKTLFEVDVRKIFGLTINPIVLQAIRTTRAKTLGLGDGMKTNYSEMDYVRSELDHARRIFAENPSWPVIDMTGKAIEETAAVLLRLFHEQKQNCSVPRISKRY